MILIVDDEAGIRHFVRAALEMAGYSVEEAGGSAEALRILDHSQPQLLITDIVMPEANGFQLAALAHRHYPGLRVIFMTGYGAQYEEELSGTVYLAKPFSIAGLLSAVESAIGLPHGKAGG
ncbi:MAG TPA: response regulator [Bryobacteraceae bacterium]|nr:response regulator [Bryobacteraceae bacterium]